MNAMLSYPPPCTYAVVQLEVQATVQNLDSAAQDAARNIKPVQCLVYLYEILEYPSTNKPWTRFGAWLVGPGPRAEDNHYCLTRNMCVPIHPTTAYQGGRQPVSTEPTFPFANCYHWAYTDVLLRVPSGDFPGRNDPKMVKMASGEMIRVDELMTEDLSAAVLAKRQREASTPLSQPGYDPADDAFVLKANVPDELVPVVTVSVIRHSETWKKVLAEQPPSDDDLASISRVSITFSDETVLSHEKKPGDVSRVKGLQKLSRVIKRLLRTKNRRDPDEDDDVRTDFFDQDSVIDKTETPAPTHPKQLSSTWTKFRFVPSFLRLHSASAIGRSR
ncbi:hypothetical protein V8D89_008413 [Ganoderma adspersum]